MNPNSNSTSFSGIDPSADSSQGGQRSEVHALRNVGGGMASPLQPQAAPQTGPDMSMPPSKPQQPSESIQPFRASGKPSPQNSSAVLIEKEYIGKAKAIIAQTKHDPYLESNELNRIKAEFLRKRYGKDLKLNEED